MSDTGVFGPAPEGIDLSKTQNASISSAVISLMVIGTIFVVLRFVARIMQKGSTLAIDDFCIAAGLVFAYGTAICSLTSLPSGGGKHLWVLTAIQFTTIWQVLFAYVIIYACAVTLTKLSIVLFYRRIFGMTWGLWVCVFLVMSYWITVVITIVASCQPLDYFWTQYTTKGATGHCINVPLFFFANGIWAMLVDVCILIVPIPIIYKLQMPRNQKMVVYLIFLLGSFVCIASIVRIITIHRVITSIDLTWAMGQLFIWSCCEPFIGIVCACLPTLSPLFRRWIKSTKIGSSKTPKVGTGSGRSEGKLSNNANSTLDFGTTKNKPWSRLRDNDRDMKLRDDDEMELTNDITGLGRNKKTGGDRSVTDSMMDIHVKRDVTWTSTQV